MQFQYFKPTTISLEPDHGTNIPPISPISHSFTWSEIALAFLNANSSLLFNILFLVISALENALHKP